MINDVRNPYEVHDSDKASEQYQVRVGRDPVYLSYTDEKGSISTYPQESATDETDGQLISNAVEWWISKNTIQ